jgi:hypothetical protein
MACNAPTCGYPDWQFTDFIATAIWRASCYRKKSQRSGMHPVSGDEAGSAAALAVMCRFKSREVLAESAAVDQPGEMVEA